MKMYIISFLTLIIVECANIFSSGKSVPYQGELSSDSDVLWPIGVIPGDIYESVDIEFTVNYRSELCSQCKPNIATCCPRILIFTEDVLPRNTFEALSCEEKLVNFTSRPDFNNVNILLSTSADSSGCREQSQGIVICERTREKKLSFASAVSKLYSITFGTCDSLAGVHLNYSVTLTNVTNHHCENLTIPVCRSHYDKVLMPGTLGYPSQDAASQVATSALVGLVEKFRERYQYPTEFSCFSAFPECKNDQRYFPCRLMCLQLKQGCEDFLEEEEVRFSCNNYKDSVDPNECFLSRVQCPKDQKVPYAKIYQNGTYLDDEITVKCNTGYKLEGNQTLRCLPNGKWNDTLPECKPLPTSFTQYIIIAVVIVIVVLSTISVVLYYRKWKKKPKITKYTGLLKYDIFVSYSSLDNTFAEEKLLEILEEKQKVPFKLCLHERDFIPGYHITDNIMSSIENSAIFLVILSRNYINSSWCMYEFKQAYNRMIHERLHPCSFIMVMMENIPKKELPTSVRGYILTCNYIKYDQPSFWKKLLNTLNEARNNLLNDSPKTHGGETGDATIAC